MTQIVDNTERVLMYASKSLTTAECNYIPYEQEALAMVWSIDLFSHYLKGRPFIVRSDCQALEWLKDKLPVGRESTNGYCGYKNTIIRSSIGLAQKALTVMASHDSRCP